MPSVVEVCSRSPRQTRDIGRILGFMLRGGEIIGLCGPLGAGKTQLAKGLALGLGVPADEPIVSPTFVLMREYAGRLRFYHCDVYRLQTVDELDTLGLEEMLGEGDGVVAIEWADRFPGAFSTDLINVDLEHESDSSRSLRITFPNPAWARSLVRQLVDGGVGATICADGGP